MVGLHVMPVVEYGCLSLQGMEVCGSIPELVHSPLCMDCWRKPTSASEELLAVGDIGGCVSLFSLEQHWAEPKRSENRYAVAKAPASL